MIIILVKNRSRQNVVIFENVSYPRRREKRRERGVAAIRRHRSAKASGVKIGHDELVRDRPCSDPAL